MQGGLTPPDDHVNGLIITSHRMHGQHKFGTEPKHCRCHVTDPDCLQCSPVVVAGAPAAGSFVKTGTGTTLVGKRIVGTVLAPWRDGAPRVGAPFQEGDTVITVFQIEGGGLLYPITPEGGPSAAVETVYEACGMVWDVQTFNAPAAA